MDLDGKQMFLRRKLVMVPTWFVIKKFGPLLVTRISSCAEGTARGIVINPNINYIGIFNMDFNKFLLDVILQDCRPFS